MQIFGLIICSLVITISTAVFAQQQYDTTWNSLQNYTVPQWYQDAKFGIYHHWGIYSVPGYGTEWYGRRMYDEYNVGPGPSFYAWHVAHYGSPGKFGHKDFIPMFHAENFNADAYIDAIIKSGAKYFAHMTSHHEAFIMYGTNLTPWNCVNMGPQKDLGRMLMTAAAKRGLKFGISNHLAENDWFYQFNYHNKFDAVIDSSDTTLKYLYNVYSPDTDLYNTAPTSWWLKRWYALSKEMIDVFQPYYVYYDNGWGMYSTFEPYRRYLGAYQYNKSIAWGRGAYGAPGAVLIYKGGGGNSNQFVTGGAVYDFEDGAPTGIQSMTFQTDMKIGDTSWGYLPSEKYKTTKYILDYLIDVVSKNGNLMLDIPPRPDGTLPDTVSARLSEIGGWLLLNGEGIYATRTANIFGSGSLRFTRNQANNVYYVFDTVWPGNGAQLAVTNYNSSNLDKTKIAKITLLGGGPVAWSQNATALTLTMPATQPAACKFAYGFKIYLDAQSTIPVAPSNLEATAASNAVILTWVDNSSKATGCKIERTNGVGDTNFTQIASIAGSDVATYSDTMSSPAAYTYRVRAYNASGNSAYSNEATPGGLLTPTAVTVPPILAEGRDFPNTLRSITTVSGDNTVRFISAHDASATFVLYSLDGRVQGRITMNAKRGPNILAWDKLRSGSPSVYLLEMRTGGQSKCVVRMIRTR
ncbi:MAG: alpha-L-fucosidase [Chitinivibrionales bacterium]